MVWIEGRRIRISRGDSARIRIEMEDGGQLEGAQAVVTVKRRPGDEEAVLARSATVEAGCVEVALGAGETERAPGIYWWDLRLLMPGGGVQTPFEPEVFEICEVVGDV